jgi:hypothetical protein
MAKIGTFPKIVSLYGSRREDFYPRRMKKQEK